MSASRRRSVERRRRCRRWPRVPARPSPRPVPTRCAQPSLPGSRKPANEGGQSPSKRSVTSAYGNRRWCRRLPPARNDDRRLVGRPDRQYADGQARSNRRVAPMPAGGQTRDHQPGWVIEGPTGARDDPRRRGLGRAQAGGNDRRTDVGQHRGRAGHRRRTSGLHMRVRHHQQGRAREDRPPQGVRRRGRRVRRGCAARRTRRATTRPPSGWSARSPTLIGPTSTPIRTTRWPTSRPPVPRSGSRPPGESPTSSPAPERAARSREPLGISSR